MSLIHCSSDLPRTSAGGTLADSFTFSLVSCAHAEEEFTVNRSPARKAANMRIAALQREASPISTYRVESPLARLARSQRRRCGVGARRRRRWLRAKRFVLVPYKEPYPQ